MAAVRNVPSRPRSREYPAAASSSSDAPPAFLKKPPRAPKTSVSPDIVDSTLRQAPRTPLPQPGAPPSDLLELPCALHSAPGRGQPMATRRSSSSMASVGAGLMHGSRTVQQPRPPPRRAHSLPPLQEEERAFFAGYESPSPSSGSCSGMRAAAPPIIHNVPSFSSAKEYMASLRDVPEAQQPSRRSSARNSARRADSVGANVAQMQRCSPIDAAIQREMIGDGIALEQAVENRREKGWAVKQRHVQKSDVGHCCHACRQPLRDLNEEVTVWTGAAIYRRFHPACAAAYVLRVDNGREAGPSVVEGYADGWRAPRDDNGGRAARQWLLSQDPTAWSGLRGDVFATVTVIDENGEKKAVPGLTHDQVRTLQTKHVWQPDIGPHGDSEAQSSEAAGDEKAGTSPEENADAENTQDCAASPESEVECAICFMPPEPNGPLCLRLPCAPQHVYCAACVIPWLKKAALCPTCRKDLRPMLASRKNLPSQT